MHLADVRAAPTYDDKMRIATIELAGARTLIGVPLLKDGQVIGALGIYRQEVRPFTDKQIELVTNFAAQAVIAIENTRLLNELRKSLQQQTATADVLRVISSSPGELKPVFQAMLENAARVCEAKFGNIFRLEDGAIRPVASLGEPEPLAEFFSTGPHRPHEDAPIMRVARTKQPVHVVDFATERAYIERNPLAIAAVELGGVRTLLVVPMLKGSELIGAIAIYRQEVRPFTEKQIELVSNFAEQAVIAIENTRLLNELRQRTDDLTESLQQQTATSEVLQVISSSPGELEPVFQAMLANATCAFVRPDLARCWLREGNAFRAVALHNAPPEYAEARRREPLLRPPPDTALGQVASDKASGSDHGHRDAKLSIRSRRAAIELGGVPDRRVPSRCSRTNELVGTITIYRQEVRPFTDKQIESGRTTLPRRLSSPSRTRGCSTSCANRWSSRPPPPMCSRLSAARPSICRPCSIRWSSRRRGFVAPIELQFGSQGMTVFIITCPTTAFRPRSANA